MAKEPERIKQPNMFEFSGDGIQITYVTTAFDGRPLFNYHDANHSKAFHGDQIRSSQSELGTLVSVMINPAVDTGSTSFTVLIPRVNLRASDSANVTTYGITALHKSTIFGAPNGQTDLYTAHQMQGTATIVYSQT
jgi:hypothetical protein